MRVVKFFGWTALVATAMTLMILTLIELFSRTLSGFFLLIIFGLLMGYALIRQFRSNVDSTAWTLSKQDWLDFLFVYFASIVTYNLHQYGYVSAVLASGLVGVIGAAVFKKHEKAIYAGSFLGMAMIGVFPPWPFIVAGLLSAIIFVYSKPLFKGVGGKLGTIAFAGGILSWLINDLSFTVLRTFDFGEGLILILIAVFAALATRILTKIKGVSVVLSSAIIGILLALSFDYFGFGLSPYLAICGFGASFVGMSDDTQLKSLISVAAGGLIFALIFIFAAPLFGGSGGKLGTMAFIASLTVIGLRMIIERFIFKPSIKA